jgi:hypothetical protein
MLYVEITAVCSRIRKNTHLPYVSKLQNFYIKPGYTYINQRALNG